jgi:hypothetical protein
MKETDAIDLLLLSAVEDNTVETAERASEIVKVFYPHSPWLQMC